MNKSNTYVLIHSPLVGGLTWALVANKMRERGLQVVVPLLKDSPDSNEPYWKQHTESAVQALAGIPKEQPVILVGHSGAGPLLPAIRESLPNPIHAYIFVDAGIASDGASRLDLMKSEDLEWAKDLQEELEHGEHFPNWISDDLRTIIPDVKLRDQLVAEIRPRRLDFFSEPIPVFNGWPDAPCIYIKFSDAYQKYAAYAMNSGWQTHVLNAGHFHMLVDVPAVTDMIVDVVNKLD